MSPPVLYPTHSCAPYYPLTCVGWWVSSWHAWAPMLDMLMFISPASHSTPTRHHTLEDLIPSIPPPVVPYSPLHIIVFLHPRWCSPIIATSTAILITWIFWDVIMLSPSSLRPIASLIHHHSATIGFPSRLTGLWWAPTLNLNLISVAKVREEDTWCKYPIAPKMQWQLCLTKFQILVNDARWD
jgi:hypothetical protein